MPEAVEGLDRLDKKLIQMGLQIGGKPLQLSTRAAMKNGVFKAIQKAAPRSNRPHKTYKGRLVAPGFAARSLMLRSSGKRFAAGATMFIKPEAFYAVKFVESGTDPHWIPHKRNWGKKVARLPSGKIVEKVWHPGTQARPWFAKTFRRHALKIEKQLAIELAKRLHKAVK